MNVSRAVVACTLALWATVATADDPPASSAPPGFGEPGGPPADDRTRRLLRGPEDVPRIDGLSLVELRGHKIIIADRRVNGTPLTLHPRLTTPLVTIGRVIPAEFPAESFAVVTLPREDRLKHIKAAAVARLGERFAAPDGTVPEVGPPEAIRPSRVPQYMVMQGRRDDHVPEPGEAPQVYVSVEQWVHVPVGGERVEACFEPAGDEAEPIGGELWQYRTPEPPAGENAEPRWTRTKPLTGRGGFLVFD